MSGAARTGKEQGSLVDEVEGLHDLTETEGEENMVEWLWDEELSEGEVKQILQDVQDPRFMEYAEKIFSRTTDEKIVFELVEKKVFCKAWPSIAQRVDKNKWAAQRAQLWQKVYERARREREEEHTPAGPTAKDEGIDPRTKTLARELRSARKKKGWTQAQLAQRLEVSQQYISKIETGRETLSLDAIERIAETLGKKFVISLK